ncbi:MAG: alcohol dehydrogenase catalytic domain-containing protein [Oscillospiraceae bacterium]|jgi:threonine dehydrogenase-like Zn-dependent dehydrogenase|nr:alcohol dehydrogenase catalytic domain-containing protein [Oscillospiraceae bacterium]
MGQKYRAAYLSGPAMFEIREARAPDKLLPGYFLGDVVCCAICGSDRGFWTAGIKKNVLGHEMTVTVTDPGDTHLNAGDRVCMFPGIPCWECESCRQGRDNICTTIYYKGYTGLSADGGYAEKYMGPGAYAVKVPDHVSSQAAALTEPLATAVHAVRQSSVRLGDKVLVIGAGPIGLYCADLAKRAGASLVVISEYSASRLAEAKKRSALVTYGRETAIKNKNFLGTDPICDLRNSFPQIAPREAPQRLDPTPVLLKNKVFQQINENLGCGLPRQPTLDGYYEASDPELIAQLKAAGGDKGNGGGFDTVFECAASAAGYATAAAVTKYAGEVIMVGLSAKPTDIVTQMYALREIRVVPSMGYTWKEFQKALALIAGGAVRPERYVTKTVGLNELQAAFEHLFHDPANADLKILVEPNQSSQASAHGEKNDEKI